MPSRVSLEIMQKEDRINIHIGTIPQCVNPPTSMNLLRTTIVGSRPICICVHDGVTYIGNDSLNTIERITGDGNVQRSFIKQKAIVSSLKVFHNELYALVRESGFKIKVFDLNGTLMREWPHVDTRNYLNKLGICGDRVVLPDRKNKVLAVYTRDGLLIKSVPLPQIDITQIALTTVGDNSVIVSHYSSNSVFKVDITSGETLWTSKHVQLPLGIVCYRDRYVLISKQGSSRTIDILDAETGIDMTALCLELSAVLNDCSMARLCS